jgi:hypothetical protein
MERILGSAVETGVKTMHRKQAVRQDRPGQPHEDKVMSKQEEAMNK